MIVGDDLYNRGEGLYFLQTDKPRFGHPHYINFDTNNEIFFEKNEYNIGKPLSSENNRIRKYRDIK